jgi:hypothetical protein
MSEPEAAEPQRGAGGDRRGVDRRRQDRRGEERRTALPLWRRPQAYVAYGVVGALVLVLLFTSVGRRGEDPQAQAAAVERSLAMDAPAPAATAPVREAPTLAQYQSLIAEGESAVGQRVRTVLFCGSISPVTVRDVERPNASLAALTDGDGRVAAAECRWSADARSSDFLLVVPPELAETFGHAPEVELNFVRRRRIPAEIEWLGRSEALSLRNAGILLDAEVQF